MEWFEQTYETRENEILKEVKQTKKTIKKIQGKTILKIDWRSEEILQFYCNDGCVFNVFITDPHRGILGMNKES